MRKWIVSQKIESQIQLFNELVAIPKKYYNKYNAKWQKSNNQYSSMNYALRISDNAKQQIQKAIVHMQQHYGILDKAHTLREIMQVEGNVAKSYYPTFALAFNPELGFVSRNSRRTYRPSDASDVINALLNYGFSILYAEVAKQLNALGLDCFVGFYHHSHSSQSALVYDMIEPFRHLIDRSVFEIQDSITRDDFLFSNQDI